MGDFGNGFTSYKVVYLTSQPKFEVIGDDSQVVNVSLGPHEKVFAEPGTFMHGSGQLKGDVECQPMCGCKAMLGGEAPLKIVYENDSEANGYIGLTPNFPAKVVPITIQTGQVVNVKPGGWMANIDDIEVDAGCDPCSSVTCCTQFPCIRQQLKTQAGGTAFLAAGGTVMQKDLGAEEMIVVDPYSLVAWDTSVNLGIRSSGGCLMCLFSGEGCFQITLTGPGRVVIQSMSFEKLKRAFWGMGGQGNDDGSGGGGDGAAPAAAEMER